MAEDLKNTPRRKSELPERLPPHSQEAEQGVLGCIFLSPNETIPVCIEKLREGAACFYDLRHQTIYSTFLELYEERDPIDVITVQARLKIWNTLEQVGGVSYLSVLPDVVPSSANLNYYLEIVREKWLLRKMITACNDVVSGIYEFEGDVDTKLDECERAILHISEARVQPGTVTVQQYVARAMEEIERSQQRGPDVLDGIATGFTDLDRMTGGLQQGEMVVIAARPSMGKTSLAMNIVENVILRSQIPVGVFSLEMSGTALIKRMICSQARVNLRNVRDGFLADRDIPRITTASGVLASAPLYLDDTAGQSVLQLRAKARRMWQQYGVRLFVIDYLQLMNALGNKRRIESRQQEISEISSGLKNLAKELQVPVIVLSQLNREVEREKRRPRMSDLRESGAIEQDADFVGFLYKPAAEDDEIPEDEREAISVNLLVAKQRNGPTGDVPLTFIKPFTRFESAARVTSADVPPQRQEEFTR